jgi:hypothetical protein
VRLAIFGRLPDIEQLVFTDGMIIEIEAQLSGGPAGYCLSIFPKSHQLPPVINATPSRRGRGDSWQVKF